MRQLRRLLDPADLREAGYVDGLMLARGVSYIPHFKQLKRHFWYRRGLRLAHRKGDTMRKLTTMVLGLMVLALPAMGTEKLLAELKAESEEE